MKGTPLSLSTNGEELPSEAGHGGSDHATPRHPCCSIQPIGHDTMRSGNNAESQWPADYKNGAAALRNCAKIMPGLAGWNPGEAEGDLACVRPDKRRGARRRRVPGCAETERRRRFARTGPKKG